MQTQFTVHEAPVYFTLWTLSLVDDCARYEPAAQDVQVLDAIAANLPASQAEHDVAPGAENMPAGQAVGAPKNVSQLAAASDINVKTSMSSHEKCIAPSPRQVEL